MRYNNYSVFKFQKKVFQPGNRFNVQTVSRFIKNQSIRITVDSLSKQNTNLLRFIQFTHHFIVVFFFQTKSRKHLFNLIFSFVSTKFTKLSFKFCRTNTIFFSKIFFCINCIPFLRNFIQFWESHHNSIFYRIFIKSKVVLF